MLRSNSAAVCNELPNTRAPLVGAVNTNSAPKFADTYVKYFGFVWSMARYMGVDETALDDVVQDTFAIVYERLCTLQRPEALRSWIYGIVRRVACTHHRTRRRALIITGTVRLESDLIHPQLPTPQQLTERSEQVELLWSLISTLDMPKREVFVLSELEEMTAPEIARVTNVPLNTVYSRLRVARQEVEAALRGYMARTQKRGNPCPI